LTSYVGQPAEEAAKALQRKGFTVLITERYSVDFPPGRVTGSDPPPGQPVPSGGTVTLFVATTAGRPVTVPDVLGLDSGSASDVVAKLGLKVKATTQRDDDLASARAHPGKVWKQDPASGTSLSPGATVTLYVNP
jgi:serine/threonine-protein kinase